jgi:ABC-type multidrug transport system fused ATPase/permease subunit
VVIDHGKVAEKGTHAQLMQNDGLYRRLNEMQFEFGVEV